MSSTAMRRATWARHLPTALRRTGKLKDAFRVQFWTLRTTLFIPVPKTCLKPTGIKEPFRKVWNYFFFEWVGEWGCWLQCSHARWYTPLSHLSQTHQQHLQQRPGQLERKGRLGGTRCKYIEWDQPISRNCSSKRLNTTTLEAIVFVCRSSWTTTDWKRLCTKMMAGRLKILRRSLCHFTIQV